LAKTSQELAVLTAELALTKKAENVISMDLRGLTSTCDFFVIGDCQRHHGRPDRRGREALAH